MKYLKKVCATVSILVLLAFAAGCENTSVGGSVSYSMGTGYGYPMYYGHHGHHHTDVIVVKPPKKERPKPIKPRPSKPKPRRR